MLKNISIENFRGISSLEIKDFKQINILLGKNNCGKTSVLESVFMLKGGAFSDFSNIINSYRNLPLNDESSFKMLFPALDFKNKGIIKTEINGIEFIFFLNSIQNSGGSYIKDFYLQIGGFDIFNIISYANNKTEILSFSGQKVDNVNEIISSALSNFTQLITFVHTKYDTKDYFQQLVNIEIDKNLNSFVKILKNVDFSIQDLRIIGDTIYFDTGLEKRIPIQIAGDGIKKILSILVAMASSENGIVLIDEIENGLHYSSMKTLWRAIIEAAKQYNVQLFITTHNAETLKYLSEVLEENEFKNFQEKVSAYSIKRSATGEIKAFNYSTEALGRFSEGHFEIR